MMVEHLRIMRIRDTVRATLVAEQEHRGANTDWVEREREAMAQAANQLAGVYGMRAITVADIERLEHQAIGHIDYTDKIAFYIAEFVARKRS